VEWTGGLVQINRAANYGVASQWNVEWSCQSTSLILCHWTNFRKSFRVAPLLPRCSRFHFNSIFFQITAYLSYLRHGSFHGTLFFRHGCTLPGITRVKTIRIVICYPCVVSGNWLTCITVEWACGNARWKNNWPHISPMLFYLFSIPSIFTAEFYQLTNPVYIGRT
jgi:hypothetical protein